MALHLGLDVGTQGCKAVVYDADQNKVVSRGAYQYGILQSNVPGRAEQHPSLWIEGGIAALSEALANVDKAAVKSLGISGQQHGFVPVDKDGELVFLCLQVIRNAKLWCDVESAPQAKKLSAMWDWTLVPGFTASKIAWLKENEPDNFKKLAKVLLPHDYFNYYLTGRYCAENKVKLAWRSPRKPDAVCVAHLQAGDASGTGLFDPAKRDYDPTRLASIDSELHNKFPELITPNEAVGTLRPEVAKQLGLTPDVVVGAGSGDNQMSALGAGAVQEGTWVMSLGTSGTLFGLSPKPILDKSGAVSPFCDASGSWLPLLCTMNCTTVTEDVRKSFNLDHETITQLAEKEEPGCSGVNFLPYITGKQLPHKLGERTPNWPHSTGVLLGLRPGSLRPGLLYRAAMEGATFSLLADDSRETEDNSLRALSCATGMKMMESYGLKAKELRVVGGGSKNRLWRRIIADSFQLPLVFPTEPESAALGAALQAAAVQSGVPVAEFVQGHSPPLAEEVGCCCSAGQWCCCW
eukprot:jgi/Astpho2/2943/Aster-01085